MPQAAQDFNQDSYDEDWLYSQEKDQDRWPKKLAFKEYHSDERPRGQKRRKPQAHRERDD